MSRLPHVGDVVGITLAPEGAEEVQVVALVVATRLKGHVLTVFGDDVPTPDLRAELLAEDVTVLRRPPARHEVLNERALAAQEGAWTGSLLVPGPPGE